MGKRRKKKGKTREGKGPDCVDGEEKEKKEGKMREGEGPDCVEGEEKEKGS